ncbi:MAG: spore germination protein [Christensenellales bacterium]
MFGYLRKILAAKKASKDKTAKKAPCSAQSMAELSSSLEKNLSYFKDRLGTSSDVVIKEFTFGCDRSQKGALLCIDGLVNMDLISENILKPLMFDTTYKLHLDKDCRLSFESINPDFLSVGEVKKADSMDGIFHDLLSGNTILLVNGSREALSVGARKWDKRSISQPEVENVVRGPRQAFSETLRTNTSLLRRIVKNPDLRFEPVKAGKQTQTDIAIAYIKGIAKPELITELKERLGRINTDAILDSGYVEAFIEDSPYSIFSTVGFTERPDAAAGKMLEGRALIIVDGSPAVLSVPKVFIENFQTAEDYFIRPYYATYLRLIRLLAYILTTLAPALYVAVTTFHQEIIPTPLLFTITAGLAGVPYPALVEALIMMLTFDILKEAGIRLPSPIGSAISIVGALVIGNAAVSAGLVGPFMVIIIAITAITSFVVPKEFDSTTVIRYALLLLAGFLGGFGLFCGLLFCLVYIASLHSFGVPYLSPITPFSREGMKDTFVRAPLWLMLFRPALFAGRNKKRQG